MESSYNEENDETTDARKQLNDAVEQSLEMQGGKKYQSIKLTRYNIPTIKELSGKEWVYFSTNNLYPQYLVDCYLKSATHSAIINKKARSVSGEGWTVENSSDTSQRSAIEDFMKQKMYEENFNQILRKVAHDFELIGAFALGVVWNELGTRISYIYHVDISKIRVAKKDKEGEVNYYYWCDNWKKYGQRGTGNNGDKIKKIAKFNPNNKIDKNQLLYVRKYITDIDYYGIPSYIGGQQAIELSYQIGNHLLNSIKRGFSPSIVLNFTDGAPAEEMKEEIFKMINQFYSGSDAAGRPMVAFTNNELKITPINSNNMNELYKVLGDWADQQIINAHQLPSPELAGLAIPGKIGGGQSVIQNYQIFHNEVIKPDQEVIEEAFNRILEINGFTLQIFIADNQPIEYQYSDQSLMEILTLSELRKRIGYAPASETDVKEIYTRNNVTKGDSMAPEVTKEPTTKTTE